jgi:hypothetical protein
MKTRHLSLYAETKARDSSAIAATRLLIEILDKSSLTDVSPPEPSSSKQAAVK